MNRIKGKKTGNRAEVHKSDLTCVADEKIESGREGEETQKNPRIISHFKQ